MTTIQPEEQLQDAANSLFILNSATVERLFQMEDGANCFALYSFYYKTAKWQRSNNRAMANNVYVQKCLNWGATKLTKVKKTLVDNGLIVSVQERKDGKIDKWYVKLLYIQGLSKDYQKQQVEKTTSSFQKTNSINNKLNSNNNNKEITTKVVTKKNNNSDLEGFLKSIPPPWGEPLSSWLKHRTKLRSLAQWNYQLKKLKTFDNPVDVVEYSIGNGYQGLFEEKSNKRVAFGEETRDMKDIIKSLL